MVAGARVGSAGFTTGSSATGAGSGGRTAATGTGVFTAGGAGTAEGLTAIYTIPDAINAPAPKAVTIFLFMPSPSQTLNVHKRVYVS